jgi:isoquinoline 1-oxidoreductase alpha subunit
MASYTLLVNGRATMVDAAPEMPLLWVLRDVMQLVGTKFGCGGGFCGACTVHLDATAVRACQTRVGDVGARRVTTIEGLARDHAHPLQRAWAELDVPQCGYCQAGQIMAAAALLARTPRPSEEEVAGALQGNLCRCATYHRIRAAVLRAAELGPATSAGGAR